MPSPPPTDHTLARTITSTTITALTVLCYTVAICFVIVSTRSSLSVFLPLPLLGVLYARPGSESDPGPDSDPGARRGRDVGRGVVQHSDTPPSIHPHDNPTSTSTSTPHTPEKPASATHDPARIVRDKISPAHTAAYPHTDEGR